MLALWTLACAAPWGSAADLAGPTRDDGTQQTATTADAEDTGTGDTATEHVQDTATDDPTDRDTETDPVDDRAPWLADVGLYLNLGDSVAAGYDASTGGGYAWLLHENTATWPSYAGHDLSTVSGAQVMHVAHSGDTSAEVLDALQDANLPAVDGTVLVTVSAGGNDFNDDATTMITEDLTRAVAQALRQNLAAIADHLRRAYPNQDVQVFFLDVQDPTDGLGTIPSGYEDGMCEALQEWGWLFGPTVVGNLAILNQAIADEAAAQGETLVPYHDTFAGHGLNSPDGWMSDDCAHPTSLGHHEVRRLIWSLWTEEWH